MFLALIAFAHAGSTSAGYWTHDVDGSTWEILGESVNAHSACGLNTLYQTTNEVQAFINQMVPFGYSNYRHYSDSAAWSTDFEQSGHDNTYNEVGDFNYVSTHGSSGAFYFCGSGGDNVVTAAETHWGDEDVDVIGLDSCNSVDAGGRTAFGAANLNAGIHYIVGFESLSTDITTTGDRWGYYLKNGYYVDTGWWYAVDDGHGVGGKAADVRFYSSSCNTWYDKGATVSCDPKSGSSWVGATWTTT
jgi:hypothetical protein